MVIRDGLFRQIVDGMTTPVAEVGQTFTDNPGSPAIHGDVTGDIFQSAPAGAGQDRGIGDGIELGPGERRVVELLADRIGARIADALSPARAAPGQALIGEKQPTIQDVIEPLRLMTSRPIRDTGVHLPDILMDVRAAVQWAFWVENRLDQSITVRLIGNRTGAPLDAGTLGPSATVATVTNSPVAASADDWMPFLGLDVSAGTTPTSGTVTIYGMKQEG